MEEGVLHIKLVDRPILGVSQSKDSADSSWLDDGAESLVVINSGVLGEPTKDLASFVSIQRAVGVELVLEYPLPSDHVSLGRSRNQIPSVIVQEGSILFFHGPAPMRTGESIAA
jgi:hypothetical protein